MFKILQTNELQFKLNGGVSISKEAQISFIVRLMHQKDVPSICLNTGIMYSVNGNELFHGGVQLIAEIPNWLDICNDDEAIRKNQDIIGLVSYATIFASGQVFRFTKEKGLNTSAIPYVEPDQLVKKMQVELVNIKA